MRSRIYVCVVGSRLIGDGDDTIVGFAGVVYVRPVQAEYVIFYLHVVGLTKHTTDLLHRKSQCPGIVFETSTRL